MPRDYDPSQTILPSSNVDWSQILNTIGTFGQMLAMSPAYGYLQGADPTPYEPRLGQSAPFPLGDAMYGQNPFYTNTYDQQGRSLNMQSNDPGIYLHAPPGFSVPPMPGITGLPAFLPYGGGLVGRTST